MDEREKRAADPQSVGLQEKSLPSEGFTDRVRLE
jgi:hypothetical protein